MTKKKDAAVEQTEAQAEPKTRLETLLDGYYGSETPEETEHLSKLVFHTKLGIIRDAVGPVEKTKNQGEKFKSMKHGDVVTAVRTQLARVGLSVMPVGLHSHGFVPVTVTRYKSVQTAQGQQSQPVETTLYQAQVNLKYKITCLDTGYEEVSEIDGAAINNEGDPAKSFGSALSYSKKYLYMQLFDINDTASDPDAGTNQESPYSDPSQYQANQTPAAKGNTQPSATASKTKAKKAIAPAEFEKLKAELLGINDLEKLSARGAELANEYDFKPIQLAALQNEIGAHKQNLQAVSETPA